MSSWGPRVAGGGAALFWILTCVRWFDEGSPFRAAWLTSLPTLVVSFPALALGLIWVRARWPVLRAPALKGDRGAWWLVVALSILFRLPLAWWGSAGYTTADGSLSGIMALHVREGIDHLVFVPDLGYSGSLKSHLTAPLSTFIDSARAFTLASVLFYALFVAAVYRLGLIAAGCEPSMGARVSWTARAAGLYAAFSPAFVTRYSLSNDGNYVEVLALGTWALFFAIRWTLEPENRPTLALLMGILLGLGFWCHILAVLHAAAVGVAFLFWGRGRALRSLMPLAGGFALGYFPGLLWNANHAWGSFGYLISGSHRADPEQRIGLLGRILVMLTDQGPVLLGYDPGYPAMLDALLRALAFLAVGMAILSVALAVRRAKRRPGGGPWVLLLFTAINLTLTLIGTSPIPGNPRYLLFLMGPLSLFLAQALEGRRWVMVLLVAFGALGSLAQAPGALRADERWRSFVSDLEREAIRFCYTDYFLAAKINFLSEERIVCSAKLGPTTTEYFSEYRQRVQAASTAALVAVNPTAAEKLERRLQRLGISYERRDLMKPVLLRLSRKVDPEELFPDRDFPWR